MLTVLCIDDNQDVLEVEKSILENSGYKVLLTGNGEEGLRLVQGGHVDLVLLDYEMPLMMGTEVARRLRDMQPALPIIIVSGGNVPEDVAKIADCCISKAEMGTAVMLEVNRLLRGRGPGEEEEEEEEEEPNHKKEDDDGDEGNGYSE
jgi:CheY-like chemotaxis protein